MKRFKLAVVATLLVVSVAGVVEAQTLPINVYSQRDSRWSGHKMGSSGLTVANYGCMMACLASAYRQTPGDLNRYLSANRGYTSGGLLDHNVAAKFDGAGGLVYVGSGSLPTTASSVGRGIQRGAVYVVRSSRPLGGAAHWVLVYQVTGGQTYYMDPWDGTTRRVGAVESNNQVWVKYGAEARIYSF